jgi:hypothetical protein
MATAALGYPFWVKSLSANNEMAGGIGDAAYVEGTSQVFKTGAPVYRSSGKVVIATVSSNKISNLGLEGIANTDATGTEDTPINITRFRAGDFWAMNFNPPSGDETIVAALLNTFVNFDVINPSTGVYYLVANNVSVDVAKPGGYIRELWIPDYGYTSSPYAVGDTNAYVVVEIAAAGGIA